MIDMNKKEFESKKNHLSVGVNDFDIYLHNEYDEKKRIFNQKIQEYKDAVNEMRNAKTIQLYMAGYKKWETIQAHFKSQNNNCGPPVPPPPPKTTYRPKIEDICHRAYKLGFEIGKQIATLINESGETYKELLEQMKCMEKHPGDTEYADPEERDMKRMCFERGRKESSRLIWGLSRNPVKLRQYLDSSKNFDHWKLAYKMGYEKYMKDLLDQDNQNFNYVTLNENGVTFTGDHQINTRFVVNDILIEVDKYRICHCRNGESFPVPVPKHDETLNR